MVKKKALFFDRDGTIIKTNIFNKKPVAIKTLKSCRIFPSVHMILSALKKNYLIFLITNQPDVARKNNYKKNVIEINNYLKKKLSITQVYTCYCDNKNCKYKKPNIGMLNKASKKYNLDLSKSYVIGDRWKDIDAGNKAGCITIFLDKKYNERINTKPDHKITYFYELRKIFKV